jgi:hypothetical protein
VMCQNKGIDDIRIAAAIRQTTQEVQKLSVRIVYAPTPTSPSVIPGTPTTIALKRPIRHLAGETLTKEQVAAQPSVPGTSYLLLTRQLLDAVRYELANRQDEVLQQALRELRDALIEYFEE